MNISLYHPEKYQVYRGQGQSSAVCTVWNNPEATFVRSPIIQQRISLLGSLYSRHGVNILLRNLALNPTIRQVLVWKRGELSNTEFGRAGVSILEALWKNGVTSQGEVQGTRFMLEPEIVPSVVERIRTQVSLVDVSHLSLVELEQHLARQSDESHPYMEAVAFDEHHLTSSEVFPSEQIGWLAREPSLVETWLRCLDRILRYGVIKGTQYGMLQRELLGVSWVISGASTDEEDRQLMHDWPEELQRVTGVTPTAIEEYCARLFSPELPEGLSYTYGYRLRAYPDREGGIDQLADGLIANLKRSLDSRRAVATTLVPRIDKDSKEPPCLTHLQVLHSEGRVHLFVTMRSHDMFKAALPNAIGFKRFLRHVADALDVGYGSVHIASHSAHIYEPDWEEARRLVSCAFWERAPRLSFDPTRDADPRGNVIIRLEEGNIILRLEGAEGRELFQLQAKTARQLMKKIAQLELLNSSVHLMDIGMELQKAELALQRGWKYEQDQPLRLER